MSNYRIYENEVDLPTYQLQRLNQLLNFSLQNNAFIKDKFKQVRLPLRTKVDLLQLPLTTKQELVDDQLSDPPFGRNHAYPISSYIRYHQTSGTTGRPLKVLDTKESWEWWSKCWQAVLQSSGVTRDDRIFLAFSFGPFIGFWAAYEGGKDLGALVMPGGGQSSTERLHSILENGATVLLCTPSYALHLAEVAEQHNMNIAQSTIRKVITAGEPGGSIPSVRNRIESLWQAKVFDHAGMTEMGAFGYSCSEQKGLHINEAEFIWEIINPETLKPVKEGERGELVLTNLGRYGYPLIRYRTGDLVVYSRERCACGNLYQFLPGGIAGRADDMVVIRGMNVFPRSIEAIVREFDEVKEFRMVLYTENNMDQIKVQIETDASIMDELASLLRKRIGLRIELEQVETGTLPRFTMKSQRVLDERINRTS